MVSIAIGGTRRITQLPTVHHRLFQHFVKFLQPITVTYLYTWIENGMWSKGSSLNYQPNIESQQLSDQFTTASARNNM